jgi:dienelactone hydrolase
MEFQRVTEIRSLDGHPVPAYLWVPAGTRAAVAVAHGYGGCKEQMLGLAARIAERGMAACAMDLRGHGEHPAPLGPGLPWDLEATIVWLRRFGRVGAVGHSLGGRLALMSGADVVVALSPALTDRPSEEGRTMLVRVGGTSVRSPSPDTILEILRTLPPAPVVDRPTLLVHGAGDIPPLVRGLRDFAGALPRAELRQITRSQHQPGAFPAGILGYLHAWLNHIDLKANDEVYVETPGWLAGQLLGPPTGSTDPTVP